ncbi:MAG: hypothetical protein ABIG68_10810, partial [Acidobacteriota bacterium]
DARNGDYLTRADVHAQPGRDFALGHIAEGRFGAPAKGIYTGIAIFNPNRTFTTMDIEAYSPANELLGRVNLLLQDNARISQTIGQLIPGITQQNGGTIRVKSSLPIYLFEVFGGADGEFLVAVPPLILAP